MRTTAEREVWEGEMMKLQAREGKGERGGRRKSNKPGAIQ
jgi:hypothetical protein